MDSALSYLRTAKARLPQDIVSHLEGRCHICNRQGHMAAACPMQTSGEEKKARDESARKVRKKNLKKQKKANTAMKKKEKRSGTHRAWFYM